MSKKKKVAVEGPAPLQGELEMKDQKDETVKNEKKLRSAKKLHIQIAKGNMKALNAYLDSYNKDQNRTTPKLTIAHAVNQALVKHLRIGKGV